MQGVIPDARDTDRTPGYGWRGTLMVWSAHAVDNPNDGCRVAEHAHAADRCAHEIVRFCAPVHARRCCSLGAVYEP